jgi:hypothetical protein
MSETCHLVKSTSGHVVDQCIVHKLIIITIIIIIIIM